MPRKFEGRKLVVASHNHGKVREISELLDGYVDDVISAGELGLPEPVEDGDSFVANSRIKARAAATASGMVALADDSGLSVNALGGAPGIYSARWAGEGKDFNLAMKRVHEEMGDAQDRDAHFVCALSLCWPDGHCETLEGRVDGEIVWPPRGDKGFGYDPIFRPHGHTVTFGEMDPDKKHAISHRANAFALLIDRCFRK